MKIFNNGKFLEKLIELENFKFLRFLKVHILQLKINVFYQ